MYLNKIKAMYDKCAANIILKNEILKDFHFKIRNEITFITTIQHSMEVLARAISNKKNKGIKI